MQVKLLVLGAVGGWIAGLCTGLLWAIFYAKGMRPGKRNRDE